MKSTSIKKYRKVVIELITNVISFSLLIIIQQIITLPIISRHCDEDLFGKIVLAFGISNIISSTFGFSLGNSRLLDDKFYNYHYIRTLNISNLFIILISFIIYNLIFPNSLFNGLVYSIICVLGSIRLFIISEFRLKDTHNPILNQNLYYTLGIIIGLILFFITNNWLLIFLTSELTSVIFSYLFYLRNYGFLKLFVDKNQISLTNYIQFMFNNALAYSLSQYDRFVIYPILGSTNVALFYSTSTASRVGGLILNPLSNYVLGKIAYKKEDLKSRSVNIIFISSIVFTVVYFIVTALTTPLIVGILYPKYLSKVQSLIIPICFGAAIMAGANILKPIIIKYLGIKFFNKLFTIYGCTLIVLSIVLCLKYRLLGVATANIISSIIFYLSLLIGLKTYSKKFL